MLNQITLPSGDTQTLPQPTMGKRYSKEFQASTLIEIIRNHEKFGEKAVRYVDSSLYEYDPLKRLVTIVRDYFQKYEKIPNWENLCDLTTLSKQSEIDKEITLKTIDTLRDWVRKTELGFRNDDSQFVRGEFRYWLIEQEQIKLALFILQNRNGQDPTVTDRIQEKIKAISVIFEDRDDVGTDVFEGMDRVIERADVEVIPTYLIDGYIRQGGIPRGKVVTVVAASGVGKSTFMAHIGSKAAQHGYNVLQVFFEESEDEYKRKNYANWSGVDMENMHSYADAVRNRVLSVQSDPDFGTLKVRRFEDGEMSISDMRSWLITYQRKTGIRIDVLTLDYFECLKARNNSLDVWTAEGDTMIGITNLARELNIVIYLAVQAKKEGKYKRVLDVTDAYGSFHKTKKADMVITIGKDEEQEKADVNRANIAIAKSKFSRSGFVFEDCVYHNGTMEVVINHLSTSTLDTFGAGQTLGAGAQPAHKGGLSNPSRPAKSAPALPASTLPASTLLASAVDTVSTFEAESGVRNKQVYPAAPALPDEQSTGTMNFMRDAENTLSYFSVPDGPEVADSGIPNGGTGVDTPGLTLAQLQSLDTPSLSDRDRIALELRILQRMAGFDEHDPEPQGMDTQPMVLADID